MIERNGKDELEQKLLSPANQVNGIKTDVVLLLLTYIINLLSSVKFHPYAIYKTSLIEN